MLKDDRVVVSVVMPTYNKANYISEALDSILMQETEYNYNIIIADDASTDNTVDIINSYRKKYGHKIILLGSEKNVMLYQNMMRVYEILRTEYFCVLDPDDYWTSKSKIQTSIDFLDKNREYTIYASNNLRSDTQKPYVQTSVQAQDSDFKNFLDGQAVLSQTSGLMYRNVVFSKGIPEKMYKVLGTPYENPFRADTWRNILHLHKGKAHFENNVDSVYRITSDGIWQGSDEKNQDFFHTVAFLCYYEFFDKKYIEFLEYAYSFWKKDYPVFPENYILSDVERYVDFMKDLYGMLARDAILTKKAYKCLFFKSNFLSKITFGQRRLKYQRYKKALQKLMRSV